jgi:hypothetical protein
MRRFQRKSLQESESENYSRSRLAHIWAILLYSNFYFLIRQVWRNEFFSRYQLFFQTNVSHTL